MGLTYPSALNTVFGPLFYISHFNFSPQFPLTIHILQCPPHSYKLSKYVLLCLIICTIHPHPSLTTTQGRRSYYALSNTCPIPDAQLKTIVDAAVTDVPSVFNIQAARVVLLTGKSKDKLWEIVKTGYLPTLGDNGMSARCFD